MAQLKVSLSIGYPTATEDDIIDIDDADIADCENDEQIEDLFEGHWQEWANGYIEASWELIKE